MTSHRSSSPPLSWWASGKQSQILVNTQQTQHSNCLVFSAVFNNVVTLNSTASNASVPFGLWALPELPFFPNLTLPGRKRRSLRGDNLDNFLDNQEDLLGEDFKSEIIDKMFGDLIAKNFKNAVRTMALMENTQCQAALGCR